MTELRGSGRTQSTFANAEDASQLAAQLSSVADAGVAELESQRAMRGYADYALPVVTIDPLSRTDVSPQFSRLVPQDLYVSGLMCMVQLSLPASPFSPHTHTHSLTRAYATLATSLSLSLSLSQVRQRSENAVAGARK